jgi:hypothetical protein
MAAAQGGQHQRLAGSGKGFLYQFLQQIGLQRILGLRRRIDVGALAFVAAQDAFAVITAARRSTVA